MFDPDRFHDPEFRTLVRAARAVLAERVHRGVATPPDRLAVAALDEMPDEEDPAAMRAWAPSAASPTKPTARTTATTTARRCTDPARRLPARGRGQSPPLPPTPPRPKPSRRGTTTVCTVVLDLSPTRSGSGAAAGARWRRRTGPAAPPPSSPSRPAISPGGVRQVNADCRRGRTGGGRGPSRPRRAPAGGSHGRAGASSGPAVPSPDRDRQRGLTGGPAARPTACESIGPPTRLRAQGPITGYCWGGSIRADFEAKGPG